jgi:hypothetical protein
MPRRQSATPGLCQEPSVAESLGTVYKSPSVRCLSGCACVFEGETKTTRLPPPSIPPPPEVNLTFRPISTLDGKEKKSEYQTRSLPRSPPGPEVYPLLPPLQTPSHLFTRHSADWLSASPPFSPPPKSARHVWTGSTTQTGSDCGSSFSGCPSSAASCIFLFYHHCG